MSITGDIVEEFEFRFNERTFERQQIYKKENGEVDLNKILEDFALRINQNFGASMNISANANSNKTITVSWNSEIEKEKDKENAKKLVDIIEFVKTMTLALA